MTTRPMAIAILALGSALTLGSALAAGETNFTWPCHQCDAGGCCCMYCGPNGTSGPLFGCMDVSACTAAGGQCKHWKTSAYARARPAAPARRVRAPARGDVPEQLHLLAGYPDDVVLVFVTQNKTDSSVEVRPAQGQVQGQGQDVQVHKGTRAVYSAMHGALVVNGWSEGWYHGFDDDLYPTPDAKLKVCGPGADGYTDPACRYTSRYIHTVQISGLQPGSAYEYRPLGSSSWTPFRTWPAVGQPISLGVLGDLGQTVDSLATMKHLSGLVETGKIQGVMLAGDLSYADGYGHAWDSYGRLGEFLWSRVPTAHITGNHEFEGEQFSHYLARYPSPSQQRSGSDTALWYSLEAGLAHVVALCSYCEIGEGTPQLDWLRQDLASVDRARTPWLVVMLHVPLYTTNQHHPMSEGQAMREAIEDLLYQSKADVVIAGHMHAYERSTGVYQNRSVCDGPIHIVVGDGGNHEGPACPWNQKELPSWGGFREYSFGHGVLTLPNATHASWTWHRNQDGEAVNGDAVWLRRAALGCQAPMGPQTEGSRGQMSQTQRESIVI